MAGTRVGSGINELLVLRHDNGAPTSWFKLDATNRVRHECRWQHLLDFIYSNVTYLVPGAICYTDRHEQRKRVTQAFF